MIIMLDEEFGEMESDTPEKTFIEHISDILGKKPTADCGKIQDSKDLSRENKSTAEKADFWSKKFSFEAVSPGLKNCKKLKRPCIHRIIQ